MIDEDGFRLNVGIILVNQENQLFWGRRVGQDAWQFPQGGVNEDESAEKAMFRELYEEVGLDPEHVQVLAQTDDWLKYLLPQRLIRHDRPYCIGQKQKWFLVRLLGQDADIQLDRTDKPEFDDWLWVSYWYPLQQVVSFKREVYRKALHELSDSLVGFKRSDRLDPLGE